MILHFNFNFRGKWCKTDDFFQFGTESVLIQGVLIGFEANWKRNSINFVCMHFLYLFSIEFIDLVWNCIGEQKIYKYILVKLEN